VSRVPLFDREARLPYPPFAAVRWYLLLAVAALAAACAPSTQPHSGPEEPDPEFIVLEGSRQWASSAVCFRDSASGLGYAFVSVDTRGPINGRLHFIYQADFSRSCDGECWPQSFQVFQAESDLFLYNLAWSPRGNFLAFEGRQEGLSTRIYTLQPGGDPRPWVNGFEPTFSPRGDRIFYVENGRDAIRSFSPSSGGGGPERESLTGAAHPAASPDGRYLAYSAMDGDHGRRIFVIDRDNPTFIADPVSDPDVLPGVGTVRDGTDDDFPTWSPHGTYIAYRAKVNSSTIYDALFVTHPAGEPENIVRLASLTPGRLLTSLRWNDAGEFLIAVIDGDVYAFDMPERYRDR
jgi:hypothetical protein